METHHHGLLYDIPDGHEHDVLHLQQPFLHSTAGLRRRDVQGKGNLEGKELLAGLQRGDGQGKGNLKGTQPLVRFQRGHGHGKKNQKGTQPLAGFQRGDGRGERQPSAGFQRPDNGNLSPDLKGRR